VAQEQGAQKAKTASSKPYLLAGVIILIITMIGIALIVSFKAAAKREREARQAAELRQMEMDRQMREAEQKVADERKAREAEELRRQQEQEALKPIGEIDRVWVDHNEYVDGLKGMKIHVKFTMKNYKDIYCTARALFYFSSGSPLRTSSITDYMTADGQIAVERRFVPTYKESSFEDFELFLPYKELPLGSGKTDLKFNVQIKTRSGDPITESEDKEFTFTKPG
jgi:type II secretory pathway pseudopilin PulG